MWYKKFNKIISWKECGEGLMNISVGKNRFFWLFFDWLDSMCRIQYQRQKHEYNSASEYLTYAVIWRTTTTKEPLFFVEKVEKYVKWNLCFPCDLSLELRIQGEKNLSLWKINPLYDSTKWSDSHRLNIMFFLFIALMFLQVRKSFLCICWVERWHAPPSWLFSSLCYCTETDANQKVT